MRTRLIVGGVAACIGIAAALVYIIVLRREVDRLTPKAEKFDSICSLAQTALLVDRQRLEDPRLRDPMIADFAGSRIGDGYAMLEWCIPDVATPVAEIRRCAAAGDYRCIERTLRTMEESIRR